MNAPALMHGLRGRAGSFRTKRAIAASLAVFVVAGIAGGVAWAVSVGSGTLGGFENDGNMVVNTAGNKDWVNVTPVPVDDDTADSGFTQGSKELKPSAWQCNTGGASPNKGNILKALANPRVSAAGAYVDLGFIAQNISGGGDVHLNFEFNQQGTVSGPFVPGACPIKRVEDDLLVTYDFPGGAALPDIKLFKWQPLASPTGSKDGDWIDQNLPSSAARAAVNAVDIPNPSGGTILAQRFGEATIDLLAALPPDPAKGCQDFGYVNVRSRSSGESITSSLQDKLPTREIDLSTCAKVIVKKVDDHVPPRPLAGATFGLFKTAAATGAPYRQCSSAADGTCTFDNVDPSTTGYWVKELSAPANYDPDPDIVATGPVGFRDVIEIAQPFVDPRHVGTIRIVKKLVDETGKPIVPDDASDLDGATFLVFKDSNGNGTFQAGEGAKLWPNETQDATCTVTGGAGYCDVGPLPTGTYGVHETNAPAGTNPGADVFPVIVTKGPTPVVVNYVNSLSPLQILIDKSGPERAHVGSNFTYTFAVSTTGPKLHALVVEEVGTDRCDDAISAPVKSPGDTDSFLEVGEVWTYSCHHTVTAGDPDPLPNKAQVTGTDDFGRKVSDDDTHLVDILKPAITLDKKVNDGDHKPVGDALLAHVGDQLTYTVKIKNTGDADLKVTALADSLKASLPTYCSQGIGSALAIGATMTCSYTSTAAADAHNVASVTGVDILGGSAGTVTASDDTFVDVIHPEIEIVKTGTTDAHEGDPVVYHFKVTNIGDVTLHGISVDDNKLGHIGDIASLAPNASQTLDRAGVAPAADVTNIGEACGKDPLNLEVCDDDDHKLNVIAPDIRIVKTGTEKGYAGDPTSYTFKVTNVGDVKLTNISVSDDILGAIGVIAALEPNESATLTATSTAPNQDLRNVATACGKDPLGKQVCWTDDHLLDIIHPGIDIDKSAATLAHEGDQVTYTFKVTNTGDVPLTAVAVTDDVLGSIGTIPLLGLNGVETLTKSYTVPANTNDVDNVAKACGIAPVPHDPFCDTDLHHLTVIHPEITLDKTVNGGDHKPVADALLAHEGDGLTYTVKVTNTGDTALEITDLEDSQNSDFADSCSIDVGDTLGVGDDFTCSYVSEAGADDINNVASVTATDVLGGPKGTVDASDQTFVDVVHPKIEVVKTGPAMAHEGDDVTYTFAVTNTGDVDLVDVAVTDDVIGDIGTISTLDVGETTTLTKGFEVPVDIDGITNTATACGFDPGQVEVCDDDPHTALVIHPDVELVKTADPRAGAPREVTYSYEVTNTGDITITDIVVTDDILGEIGTIESLDPGESKTLTRSVDVDEASPTTNIGEACGDDPLGFEVCDNDDETIAVVLATVEEPPLPKTGLAVRFWLFMAGILLGLGAAALNWEEAIRRRRPA